MDGPVLLVEGQSDAAAVQVLSRSLDLPLRASSVVAMHGITNLRRHLQVLSPAERARVGVLHDAGETRHVENILEGRDATVPTFVCMADLEDELIRALGTGRAVEVVEDGGDEAAWRTIGRQPFHRDRPTDR